MENETHELFDRIWEKLKEKAEEQEQSFIDDNKGIIITKNKIWKKIR